jgi:hypothetical protein
MAAAVALAGTAAAYRAPSAAADPTDAGEPDPQVQDRLSALERTYNAVIGVHCVDFETGRSISCRDAELIAICSTFKTLRRGIRSPEDAGNTNDIGMVYGPGGRRVILSVMTRSQSLDPKAPKLRPLITEVARFAEPYVIEQG